MSIDWNTAPEGATHWEPAGPDFYEGWMKKEGNEWFYWGEGANKWFKGKLSCNVSAEREATFEARPQEQWDGQGLPPVGIECETWHVCQPDDITVREILFMGSSLVVMSDKFRGEVTGRLEKVQFRPIRTPEQIAAEEREKAVQEMLALDEYPHGQDRGGMMSRADFCRVLYDAGYRRQESST
ncbi:hypothetical protein [Pseudomonas aeruginosa]|uniref:hypothetical protein n=1 Tax=Pseudomonas aeruginosa TaxID=287 RepID=UPI001D0A2946|nr:hypothetical protein [Pseudomonas aeruginosa]MCC0321278.1 hypothetical protein [Pseudomonas aeruginosa]